MRNPLSNSFLSIMGIALAGQAMAASPWARFHGSDGLGYVAEGEIPATWTDADYRWRYQLSASDVGSPIVANGSVYFVESVPESSEIALVALDFETGERRWSRSYPHPVHHLHKRNSFASTTPAADENRIYIAYAEPEHTYLKCFDHDGNEVWSRDFGRWQSQHGFGSSPRIVGSMVVLLNSQQGRMLRKGQQPGQSRVIAVNRQSGETVWQENLNTTRTCYGIPASHIRGDGSVELVGANTGDGIFGLDAATGEMTWSLKVFGKRCCSTPLVVGNLAIGSCGSGGGGNELVAVKIPQSKDEQPTEVYRIDRAAPYVPTPAIKGDQMFTIDDKGIASCLNVKSGSVIWSRRIGGNFGASPIVVGDQMLVISLRGEATVLRAGAEFEKLGEFNLGGPVGATPAYAEGHLILRVGDEIRAL